MTDERQMRLLLMRARGSAALAISIIDNHGAPPEALLAHVRDALERGFTGEPLIHPQVCPAGLHRSWWADTQDLPCPWCERDEALGSVTWDLADPPRFDQSPDRSEAS